MVQIARIVVTRDTYLKKNTQQSNSLPSTEKQYVPQGTVLALQSYKSPTENHIPIFLREIGFGTVGLGWWYIFNDHAYVLNESFTAIQSVDEMVAKQYEKNAVKVTINNPYGLIAEDVLKLVVNQNTVIKRIPTPSSDQLADKAKQVVPAGTELIIMANKANNSSITQLPLEKNHVKFTLKNFEIKGYRQDWYAFDKHVGLKTVELPAVG